MIVLLSGEIAAGKTAVATELETQFRYRRIRSGDYLARVARSRGLLIDRRGLQELGDLLDQETQGSWIAEVARNQICETLDADHWVLDSVRRDFQVHRFREVLGADVIHVHLMAADNILNSRFHSRAKGDDRDSGADYAQVKTSETEQHTKGLGGIADISVNSGTITSGQIARLINLVVKLQSEEAAE